MKPSPKTPVERIRREEFKISQAALAKIAKVTQATVSRWEKDLLQPGRAEMILMRDEALRRRLSWDDRWFFEMAPSDPERAA